MQVCGAAIGWLLGDISLSIGLALCMGGMVWLDPAASLPGSCADATMRTRAGLGARIPSARMILGKREGPSGMSRRAR